MGVPSKLSGLKSSTAEAAEAPMAASDAANNCAIRPMVTFVLVQIISNVFRSNVEVNMVVEHQGLLVFRVQVEVCQRQRERTAGVSGDLSLGPTTDHKSWATTLWQVQPPFRLVF